MMVGQLILSLFERMISNKTELEGKGNNSPDAGPVSNTETDMGDVMHNAIASNGPNPMTVVKRSNLLGWVLEGISELFISGSRATTSMSSVGLQLDVTSIDDIKSLAKSKTFKDRAGQVGSYTIYFTNGKKYHGKGPLTRMLKSATTPYVTDVPADEMMVKQMMVNKTGVASLDWTPAYNHREAFKAEYRRMQKDATKEYPQGVDNPINYNIRQSPGYLYILQDGF